MNSEVLVTPEIAKIFVRLCFNLTEFSRLYDTDYPSSAKHIFECNQDIKRGFKWFIGADSAVEMQQGIHGFKEWVEFVIQVYNGLNFPLDNKESLLEVLNRLRTNLDALGNEVQEQIS